MQNPASRMAIHPHPGSEAFLLGLWTLEGGRPVVAAWEAQRRFGRATRYSLFVPLPTLVEAQDAGWADHQTTTGERVYAFQPEQLARFIGMQIDKAGAANEDNKEAELMMENEAEVGVANMDDGPRTFEYETISEGLSNLSDGEVPSDFNENVSAFSAEDVDWTTNAWLSHVSIVQGWLQLDAPMELESGAERALTTLFETLDSSSRGECFNIVDGHARLTEKGGTLLENRIDQAQSHKDVFQRRLESGDSVAAATNEWRESWDEDLATDDSEPVRVIASVKNWQIYQFRDHASSEGLSLNPSYQRDVVWTDKESRKLVDSLLRGIPLPSIILNQPEGSKILEIVDGKQRLTSILRFMGRHPDGVRYAKVKSAEADVDFELYGKDYPAWRKKVRRAVGLTPRDEKENFLPFTFKTESSMPADPLLALSGKYYCQIKDEIVRIQGQEESVHELFEHPSSEYYIPVILYKRTDLRQIHQVFGLYNKQGRHLNATELRNAIYHHLPLTKLLLALSGDSDAVSELAPYLANQTDIELNMIPEVLTGMVVSESRFNRTKLASWVSALLLQSPDRKRDKLTTPSTSGFIETLLHTLADRSTGPSHPMRTENACKSLAEILVGGATILAELQVTQAFAPSFTHKKNPGEKWEDLPAVAAWTACSLACVSGTGPDVDQATRDRIRAYTASRKPLEKQQSRSQWIYIASTTLGLVDAFGLDRSQLAGKLRNAFGYDCLETFELVAQLA